MLRKPASLTYISQRDPEVIGFSETISSIYDADSVRIYAIGWGGGAAQTILLQ